MILYLSKICNTKWNTQAQFAVPQCHCQSNWSDWEIWWSSLYNLLNPAAADQNCSWNFITFVLWTVDTSRWLAISHHSHFHSLFVSFWLLTTIVIRDRVAPWRRSITKIECGFALIICRLQTPPDRFSSMFLLQSESETQWQWSWILHRVHGADDCGNNYECNENQSKGHHLQCRCS